MGAGGDVGSGGVVDVEAGGGGVACVGVVGAGVVMTGEAAGTGAT